VWEGVLSGSLKIRCHYFEMGNMQFNLDKTFDSIPCKDITNAKDIIAAIKAVEDKVSHNPQIMVYYSQINANICSFYF
jgi:pterin-4a-carbinolamine dehydratase